MPDPGEELLELFDAALRLPADQRGALLAARCAGRPALRAEVESLLAHAGAAGDFLEDGPRDTPLGAVGPYELEERIGEGGFGEVWRARQREPIARTVAVKLIRPGVATPVAVQRFAAERQALASLDHPNVARIHDAGTASDGRPWYAMELVDGLPITEFCERHRVGLADRIRLVMRVCAALHHAHERGIVHRDLKPSNVLVVMGDGERPVPKVIDFGVAKLREGAIDGTGPTRDGQVVGTPAYMSPEQARGQIDRVDARTDVHALGVMLFELLTGTLPFEPDRESKRDLVAWHRCIRDDPPPRPSTRIVQQSGDADYRAPVLPRAVRGDLDWIVLRALEKEPERRYPTADALGRDLDRFLRDEPVSAGPPDRLYRLRKWVSRHRTVASLLLLVIVATGVGAFGTIRNLVRAQRSEAELRAEASKLRAVADFLRSMLASADPDGAPGREVRVRDVLDEAARDLDAGLSPDVEAVLRYTLGTSYRGLGQKAEAERHLARAVELADARAMRERGEIRRELALVLLDAGRIDEADSMVETAIALAESGGDRLEMALALDARGTARMQRARYAEAAADFRAAIERAPEDGAGAVVATAILIHLANALQNQGDPDGAAQALADAMSRVVHEGESGLPRLLQIESSRLRLLQGRDRVDEALRVAEECVSLAESIYGAEHPEVGFHRCNLAEVLQDADRLQDARREFEAGIGILKASRPDGSITLARALANLGWLLARANEGGAAEKVMEEGLAMRRRFLGDDHPDVGNGLCDLSKVLRDRGDLDGAERLGREALAIHLEKLGADHFRTAVTHHSLALTLAAAGEADEAVEHAAEAVRIATASLPEDHLHVVVFRRALGLACLAAGRFDAAREQLELVHARTLAREGADHAATLTIVHALIECAVREGDEHEAERWRGRLPRR